MNWRDEANCLDVPGDLWFPDLVHSREHKMARVICMTCPVKVQCLDYALDNNIEHGTWGGLLPLERKALRREARKKK